MSGKALTKIFNKRAASLIVVISVLALMIIVFSILSPYFLQINNFYSIGLTIAVLGILTIGQSLCLILGGFDLSVGYMLALGGVINARLTLAGIPYILTIVITLAIGAFGGFLNGIIITKLRVNAFIATLGTMTIFHGLVFILSNGSAVMVNREDFTWIGSTRLGGIPLPIIILVILYALFYLILKYTILGRKIYLVGGNADASKISGINTDNITIAVFTLSSLLAAFGGIVFASRVGAAQVTVGSTYALDSVTAALLGGIALSGGKGNIFGALLGVFIMGVLQNGLIMLNIMPYYQYIATGIVLILAIMSQTLRKKGS